MNNDILPYDNVDNVISRYDNMTEDALQYRMTDAYSYYTINCEKKKMPSGKEKTSKIDVRKLNSNLIK